MYLIYQQVSGACPGAWAPPPLEIENQIKKKVIRANFKLFQIYFATFLVENIIFSSIFWAGPPLKKLKSKKKSFQILAPPPLTNSWTRAWVSLMNHKPQKSIYV